MWGISKGVVLRQIIIIIILLLFSWLGVALCKLVDSSRTEPKCYVVQQMSVHEDDTIMRYRKYIANLLR